MKYTLEQLQKMMEENGGRLYLSGTQITALPDNLTVGGWLYLNGTQITALPDNLTVGGSLDLSGTQITALPDNLTVGGRLYLNGTQITALPDNLTVGGSLDLRGTQITALPDNLTVGGWLDLSGTQIKGNRKVRKLKDGDLVPDKYIYCDGILTHIKKVQKFGAFTYYVGKIKGQNVISDGETYAHCKTFKQGVLDLEFKKAKDRGAEQYKHLTADSVMTKDEAITMYRVITGACQAGTQRFLDSLGELKESYTVGEIIDLTKGQYGSAVFEEFIEANEKNKNKVDG